MIHVELKTTNDTKEKKVGGICWI